MFNARKMLLFTISFVLLCSGCTKDKITENSDDIKSTSLTTDIPVQHKDITEEMDLLYDEISTERWDGKYHDFNINVMLFNSKMKYEYKPGCDYKLLTEDNLKNISERNKEYFTCKGDYVDYEGNNFEALYYFCDNNAYVLYTTEENRNAEKSTWVHLRSRMIWEEIELYYTDEKYIVKVPYPVCVEMDSYDLRKCWENQERWDKKYMFSNCTYEDAKEFYSMFSQRTAIIDDKNKVIKVRGIVSSVETEEINDIWAVFDFKNETYEVFDEDGKLYHSCKTYFEKYEKCYKSAGIIGDREVVYDTAYNMYVKENGKYRMILNDLEMDNLMESIQGYSCVGEECKLKLTKIKGDKFYFDVAATLVEDGTWLQEYILVVENLEFKLKEK